MPEAFITVAQRTTRQPWLAHGDPDLYAARTKTIAISDCGFNLIYVYSRLFPIQLVVCLFLNTVKHIYYIFTLKSHKILRYQNLHI